MVSKLLIIWNTERAANAAASAGEAERNARLAEEMRLTLLKAEEEVRRDTGGHLRSVSI